MELLTIVVGSIATLVGIIAGIIQVVQYVQERKKKTLAKEKPAEKSTKLPKVYHNLPPRTEFIGRVDEKKLLHDAINSRAFLISVDGIGGIGKSSLALEVVYERFHEHENDNKDNLLVAFDGYIWSSAKDRELTLNGLLDTIARAIDYSGVIQQPLEDKLHLVRQKLRDMPYLIIVDNFETITDDGVADFLLNMPEPSKALITTRAQKLRQARSITIKGLPELEALALIRNEGQRLGLGSLSGAENRVLARLYEATGGAPLAIKWAVGQMKQKGQSLDTVLAYLHEAHGDIFVQVFERSWNLCIEASRHVLQILPLFATPVSHGAIETVSDVHHFVLDEALGQLVEMSLIEASDELDLTKRRYGIHPLTRAFAMAELEKLADVRTEAINRLADYYETISRPYLEWYKPYPNSEELELEILNVYQTIQFCLNTGLYERAFVIFYNLCNFVFTRGYWNDALEISQTLIEHISESTIPDKEIIVARLMMWPISPIFRHRGNLDDSEKYTQRAGVVFKKTGNRKGEASVARALGRIAHERKDYETAEKYLAEALGYYNETGNLRWHQLLVTLNLADLALQRGDLEKAWELSETALPLADEMDDLERIASILAIKAGVLRRRGKYLDAKDLLEKTLALMKQVKRLDSTADTLFDLGEIERLLGNTATAKSMFEEALEIYRQMGIQTKVLQIEKTLVPVDI